MEEQNFRAVSIQISYVLFVINRAQIIFWKQFSDLIICLVYWS